MLGTTEKDTYLTKLKDGGRFAIHAFGIHLAATFTIGCLWLIVGSPLLTFPLTMLISRPVVWAVMGVVLTVIYKVAIEPLFCLVRDHFKGKKTDQEKQKTPDGDSGIKSSESEQTKKTQVKTYNTAGNGNCFFYAVFGDNSSGQYKAEKAQEMRLEWHKFLSQFTSLDDASMPTSLKAQLGKVFNMFLNKPEDLTGKSDKIKKLAEHTNKKIKKVKRKVEKLIRKLLRMDLPENEVKSNLKELAVSNFFSAKRYDKNYNSESAANSLLNSKLIYKSYLEAIRSQSYYVFIEEIPILASLADIEIDVHYKNNGNDVHTVFKPNPEMINEGYQQNDELWGNRERETIYLKPDHYEKAEVASSVLEKPRSIVCGLVKKCANALGPSN
ncbi:hypothetical protein [Wolbachia endosymbiont of Cimex lectularius]|uniref:hypothetical protein n=1 Tax=Wolbachia endosymbiont of Cimex lectularius TaxID=246273 RepID=UPI00049AF15C|nr:hypothetical protein [Wolbachia endosymbiont of Cimex lectularius]BAP00481.1 putative uncharacterized protein [Wolbachia endosymbiont of Cimex lectularius]